MADSLLLKALRRESLSRPPVWLMRQAGRSLPEYRALRKRAGSFLSLLKTPAFACEAALQPIERFGMDAAILFSDILTIPDAMGLGLEFIEAKGRALRIRLPTNPPPLLWRFRRWKICAMFLTPSAKPKARSAKRR